MNVAVHLFLNDQCEGPFAAEPGVPVNTSKEMAYVAAQKLVDDANSFLRTMNQNTQELNHQWGQLTHGAVKTEHQYITIQYVLCDVLIHCDQFGQTVEPNWTYSNYITTLADQTDGVIDLFLTNNVGSNGGGFARENVYALTENFKGGLSNHELGHYLELDHTFQQGGDGCNDTWHEVYQWDANNDGINDTSTPVQFCWDQNQIAPHPVTGVDADACGPVFNVPHPCCDFLNHNNNLMCYGSWHNNSGVYSALTPCQLTKMLEAIDDHHCDKVNCIDCCAPPKSVIGVLPTSNGELECPTCFHLQASDNDIAHLINIVDVNSGASLYTSGWQNSPANKFCIEPEFNQNNDPEWPYSMISGNTYIFSLTVENDCEESHQQLYEFELPPICQPAPNGPTYAQALEHKFSVISVTPNPATNYINVTINSKSNGEFRINGLQPQIGQNYGLLMSNEIEAINSNQTVTINTSQFLNGVNTLIFQFDGEIHSVNFLKQ